MAVKSSRNIHFRFEALSFHCAPVDAGYMRSLMLDDLIDGYEAALATRDWRSVSVIDFTPPPSTPEYWPTLVELLRVRMEHAAERDESQGLQQPEVIDWDMNACLTQFPELQKYPEYLSELAYEEYRLKRAAGLRISPLDYRDGFQIDISSWNTTLPKPLVTHDLSAHGVSSTVSMIGPLQSSLSSPLPTPLSSPSKSDSAAEIKPLAQRTQQEEFAPGTNFGSFRILCTIGSGALARVYLAQQLDLSERAVILKVSSQATLEPQKIALLQHPHIVQIFSVHELSGYQVLCMPYAGATTLADFLQKSDVENKSPYGGTAHRLTSQQLVTTLTNRQRAVQTLVDDHQPTIPSHSRVQLNHGLRWPERWDKMSYEEITCELLLQVARGLAHAHRFGIVHSDLKPANILVGDDGQARLVDFNVSQQMASADRHLLGGTLPYMAPEHLQSLLEDRWLAGPASDIYSLGVIAFQLLSSRLPFESTKGSLQEVLEHAIGQRRSGKLDHQLTPQHASVDMRSIIERCLQPDANKRYESADALCEDLERHLQHRPLKHAPNRSLKQRARKWATRHPRVSSATSVAVAASICMIAVLATTWFYRNQLRRERAQTLLSHFRAELPKALVHAVTYRHDPALVTAAADASDRLLSVLRMPNRTDPHPSLSYLNADERAEIASALGQLDQSLLSSAQTTFRASSEVELPDEIRLVIEATKRWIGELHASEQAINKSRLATSQEFELLQSAISAFAKGQNKLAIENLRRLLERSPSHYAAWLLLGTSYVQTHQLEHADAAFGRAVSIMPDLWQGWFYHGQVAHASAHASRRRDQYETAVAYFSRALQLKPDIADALLNRALCYEQIGDVSSALKDIERLLELKQLTLRTYLVASRLNKRLGNEQLASDQMQLALKTEPQSAQDFVYRGSLRLQQDRAAAAEDFRRASELDPDDPEVLQSLAVLLMEIEPDAAEAAQVLDRWVQVTGGSALALASRGVLRARNGQRNLALIDAADALRASPKPRERAQVASIFVKLAAVAGAEEARELQSRGLSLLAEALQLEWKLITEVQNDPDMSSLRDDPRFQQLIQTVTRFGQLPSLMKENSHQSKKR